MSQPEREDEAAASNFVSQAIGVEMVFNGHLGGIDYVGSRDSLRVVLEVTRFTSSGTQGDWNAAAKFDEPQQIATHKSWWVTFDGYPRYTNLGKRMGPALRDLEFHGLTHYYRPDMEWWLIQVRSLRDVVGLLNSEKVMQARVFLTKDPSAAPRLFISPTGSWTYGGSDEAIAVLETYLKDEHKHLAKTAAEPADERHLFIWSDSATPNEYARAFAEEEHWRALPSKPPYLPHGIAHLWLVHEPIGRGWHWALANGWSEIVIPVDGPNQPK